ncbi:hypothetical protein JTE90_014847 [Oedothorax gibbosus]|uniref:Uncharacterized protein n=1 Tax=Oedothorax gibbosus TaxID=931172 RepID=A0AAV6U1H6_9ARAC|nr:hypothetical protein JTE90_014847 [Oedothorax gibbosus]
MPDGKVKLVHHNKIREFIVNCNAVNVIFEGDDDFGRVENVPTAEDRCNFARKIDGIQTARLPDQQVGELKIILLKLQTLFTRTLQPETIDELKIELLPGVIRESRTAIAYRWLTDQKSTDRCMSS